LVWLGTIPSVPQHHQLANFVHKKHGRPPQRTPTPTFVGLKLKSSAGCLSSLLAAFASRLGFFFLFFELLLKLGALLGLDVSALLAFHFELLFGAQ
jgi:hypothetical protein